MKIFFIMVAVFLTSIVPANAGIEALIATAIHGFLLSSTGIIATQAVAGTIAGVLANAVVGGVVADCSQIS